MPTKETALTLFDAALQAVMPNALIGQHCRIEDTILYIQNDSYALENYRNIYLFGSGKAVEPMAKAMQHMLGSYLHSGLIVAPQCQESFDTIRCKVSDHPIPTLRSVEGATALRDAMQRCTKDDLFIYLLSGGSSALIEIPMQGVSLQSMQSATDLMLKNSLSIDEINTVRKHLSAIKGGRLAAVNEATGIVLVVSDVIGDDLYSIGSAPLFGDRSTFRDAVSILQRHNIYERMPKEVQVCLQNGLNGLKEESPALPREKIRHYLVGTNVIAKRAAAQKALQLGLRAEVITDPISGDAAEAAEKMIAIALESDADALIFGGETTVHVQGKGRGGRNQQCVLSALALLGNHPQISLFLSAGTDGIDGNCDAAGAFIDEQSALRAKKLRLDIGHYLNDNDAYHFFQAIDSLVITGPTGTNVMDIAIIIKE